MTNLNIVILCGGSGSRLWPLSRELLPKQFLKLVSKEYTMFQMTCNRIRNLKYNKIFIICNQEHILLAEQQIEEIGITNYQLIGEPFGKNTSSAVAIACQLSSTTDNLLVVSSDHVFNDQKFIDCVNDGLNIINSGIIVFGIKPDYPETGYGYLQYEGQQLLRFVEKPHKEVAERYLAKGNYLWNSGNFLFKNSIMIKEFNIYASDIWNQVKLTLDNSKILNNKLKLNPDFFSLVNPEDLSIDYAIMENHQHGKVIKYDSLWSDIGSFKSLYDFKSLGTDTNVFDGLIYNLDSKNCYVKSDKIVSLIGVDNLVVIDTDDVLLISEKERSQDVKKVVNILKKENRIETKLHNKVFRPWGWYININGDDHSGSKVKRITVLPGKRLSLQSHKSRSEHWVITKGNAVVQLGEKKIEMKVNDYIFIPTLEKHRMENLSDKLVEFVETQIGDYLGEDDIIRYQDDFGRE